MPILMASTCWWPFTIWMDGFWFMVDQYAKWPVMTSQSVFPGPEQKLDPCQNYIRCEQITTSPTNNCSLLDILLHSRGNAQCHVLQWSWAEFHGLSKKKGTYWEHKNRVFDIPNALWCWYIYLQNWVILIDFLKGNVDHVDKYSSTMVRILGWWDVSRIPRIIMAPWSHHLSGSKWLWPQNI